MEKKITLNELVRNEANRKNGNFMGSYGVHHKICKELVELSDKHSFPMGVLVYIGIGTNAHRPIVFEGRYSKLNRDKVEKVIKLCKIFSKKFGDSYYTNDKVVHALSRYYDVNGGNELKFRQIVNSCNIDFKTIKISTAKQLAKILFDKEATYSNGGYIVSVSKPLMK